MIVFFSILLFLAIIAIINLISWPIIKIDEIKCQLNENPCPKELIEELNHLKNKSFLFLNIKNQIANINFELKILSQDSFNLKFENDIKEIPIYNFSKNRNILL